MQGLARRLLLAFFLLAAPSLPANAQPACIPAVPDYAFRPAATRQRAAIAVDWSHYADTCTACTATWRVLRRNELDPGGGSFQEIATQAGTSLADAPPGPGLYRYQVEIASGGVGYPDAQSMPSGAVPFGLVPTPFTTVGVSGNVVSVLGRTYVFGNGPLPTAVTVHPSVTGLAADVALVGTPTLELSVDGMSYDSLVWSAPALLSQTGDQVVLQTSATAGPATLTADLTIEFDGNVLVELSISAPENTPLDHFSYTLRMADASVSRYYDHHVEYEIQNQVVFSTGYFESAGLLPAAPVARSFVPSFSLGNQTVALEWVTETNANWSGPYDAEDVLEYGGGGSAGYLTVTPLPEGITLTSAPWTHAFSLVALPGRPRAADSRSHRFDSWNVGLQFRHDIGLVHNWILTNAYTVSSGLPIMNTCTCVTGQDYYLMQNADAQCGVVGTPDASTHANVLAALGNLNEFVRGRFIPYGAMVRAPAYGDPVINQTVRGSRASWQADGNGYVSIGADAGANARYGYVNTIPSPQGYWSYGPCFDESLGVDEADGLSFGAYMVEKILEGLEDPVGGVESLYFDFGSIGRQCATNVGTQRQEFNYFDLRETWKNLRIRIQHSSKPEALVNIHLPTGPKATGLFGDYLFVGEPLFAVWKQTLPYVPDYLALAPGFLESQMFPRPGGEMSLIPQLGRLGPPSDPAFHRGMRALLAAHGWHLWSGNFGGNAEAAVDRKVEQAFYLFGSRDDATFTGYWESPPVSSPDALVSTWEAEPGKVLVAVANLTGAPVADAMLDLSGLPPGLSGLDTWMDLEAVIETCNIGYRQTLSTQGGIPLGGLTEFGCGPGGPRNPTAVKNPISGNVAIGAIPAGDFRLVMLCEDGVSCNDEGMAECLLDTDCAAGEVCGEELVCMPEPSALWMAAAGAAWVGLLARRRRERAS